MVGGKENFFKIQTSKTAILLFFGKFLTIYYRFNGVPPTFLLVCFLCLKESTHETRKNIFYFTSKALFVLEIITFKLFRYSNVMTPPNVQA